MTDEQDPNTRDIELYKTILSGDIGIVVFLLGLGTILGTRQKRLDLSFKPHNLNHYSGEAFFSV